MTKTEEEHQKLMAWLRSQVPKPPDAREKKRMVAAIEFDLANIRVWLGVTVESRLNTFRNLGYLYDE